MSGVHYQGLFVGHFTKVLHRKWILCPVLKHSSVATVSDKFVRVLGHPGIQIVLNHHHNGRSLRRMMRIFVHRTGIHCISRTIPIHIDSAVTTKLFGKFGGQFGVQLLGEIPQGVA